MSDLRTAFESIVQFRRSNRAFDPATEVPEDVIQQALEQAMLSPNSSNMQLWEFHWIQSPELKQQFISLCLDQSAAKTAKHLIVFVTRQDLWKKRAKWNLEKVQSTISGELTPQQKGGLQYYKLLIGHRHLHSQRQRQPAQAQLQRPAPPHGAAVEHPDPG